MKRNLSILGPLILLILLSLACSFFVDLGPSSHSEIIDVQADQVWTRTGIEIEAGDHLVISYLSGGGHPVYMKKSMRSVMEGIHEASVMYSWEYLTLQ